MSSGLEIKAKVNIDSNIGNTGGPTENEPTIEIPNNNDNNNDVITNDKNTLE